MEEQSNLIVQALPPILTSIGGFFILLFFGYTEDIKQNRFMLSALFVLLIWIVYIVVILAGEKYTLFSPYITIASLIVSLILLTLLLIKNISPIPKSKKTTHGIDFIEDNIRAHNKISFSLILFILASIFSTIGFSNYFGMQGRAVIAVKTSICPGAKTINIKWSEKNNANEYPIDYVYFFNEIGIVFDSTRLNNVGTISIACTKKEANKPTLNHFQKNSRGLGVEYVYHGK